MTRILAAALSSALLLASASAETLKDTLPHISVTGEASEEALPDRAILHLDIVADRLTATEAVTENERKTRSYRRARPARRAIDDIRVVGATLQAVATGQPRRAARMESASPGLSGEKRVERDGEFAR